MSLFFSDEGGSQFCFSFRRKYWDENYVHSLENQVETLRSLLQKQHVHLDPLPVDALDPSHATDVLACELNIDPLSQNPHIADAAVAAAAADFVDVEADESTGQIPAVQEEHTPTEAGSKMAMEELSVMMWRTNLGDGVTIVNESTEKTIPGPSASVEAQEGPSFDHIQPPAKVLKYWRDPALLESLASLFLQHINQDHQFTEYTTTDFLQGFPSQPIDRTFLHAAIFAVGSTFSKDPDARAIGDAFEEYAESLAFLCCRYRPSLSAVQGLAMLSWRCLALGEDHFGWMYISMAAGMAVHLRLHVLALDEFAGRAFKPTPSDIHTFWMFFMTDWSAISILGRNCVLPWRRVNVPDFASTFGGEEPTLDQLSFAWQCKLWYMHDQNIEQMWVQRSQGGPGGGAQTNEPTQLFPGL